MDDQTARPMIGPGINLSIKLTFIENRKIHRSDFLVVNYLPAYADLFRKGVAYFLAGEFKDAARAFGRVMTPEADFNKGNALVMQGKYMEATEAYKKALDARPDWMEAKANREIARLRAERVKTEGGEMTGGMLEADDFVFTAGKKNGEGEKEVTDGGNPLSDEALQALWLRRIQTKPADFLRAKFAYQAQHGGAE